MDAQNTFQDFISGIASGLGAEAAQKGEGAGLAAGFAAGAGPLLQRRADRLDAESLAAQQEAAQQREADQHAHDDDGFVALPPDVEQLMGLIDDATVDFGGLMP